MKLGIKLPYQDRNASSADLKRYIRTVDDLGFDSMWLGDHIVLPDEIDRSNYQYLWRFSQDLLATPEMQSLFPEKYFLEAMVACGFIAGVSDRLAIGIGVLVVPMRNAVATAAELATLDVLCSGRVIAGVGTGWAREEFRALGREAEYSRRGRLLDESIDAMRTLWGSQPASFSGTYVEFDRVHCDPTPVQGDRLPIWIGGDSDRALRRVVEKGDGWQPVELPPEEFAERSRQLDRMLADAGRDPATVARSVSTRLPLSTASDGRAQMLLEQYRTAGCDHLVMYSGWRNSIEQNTERAHLLKELAAAAV